MAASATFLSAAQAAAEALPEYAAFQAALTALSAAGEDGRQAAWNACYGDGQAGLSPAYRLRRALRDVVVNTQVSQAVTLAQADAEAAYQQLVAQLAPDGLPPAPPAVKSAVLTPEDLDLIRLAAGRLASD